MFRGLADLHELFLGYWFAPYLVVAYAVILFRIVTHRFTKAEWILLVILVGHHLLEFLQLWVGDGFRIVMLPDRYFQVVAPLSWAWTAFGLIWLWRWRKGRWGVLARVFVVALIAEVIGYEAICKLSHEYRKGTNRDGLVAGRKLAPFILEDYKGPSRHENFPYSPNEYFTSRRPVVKGDAGRALIAWTVRGQIALPLGPYPLKEDYFIRRVDRYFEELPEDQYEFMAEAKGTRRHWRLYRRKASAD